MSTGSQENAPPIVLTLTEALAATSGPGAIWNTASDDLNVNLVSFDNGQGIEAHVNNEVDVLIVIVAGEGAIEINGEAHPVRSGQLCLIPKGASRAFRSGPGEFSYITCHRRRQGLWPV